MSYITLVDTLHLLRLTFKGPSQKQGQTLHMVQMFIYTIYIYIYYIYIYKGREMTFLLPPSFFCVLCGSSFKESRKKQHITKDMAEVKNWKTLKSTMSSESKTNSLRNGTSLGLSRKKLGEKAVNHPAIRSWLVTHTNTEISNIWEKQSH